MKVISKIAVGFSIVVVIMFVAFFAGCWIEAANRPEHKVKVEYVIYCGSNAYEKSEVYSVKGEKFKSRIYTRSQRYGNGPNVFEVIDADAIFGYFGKQRVRVYTGYNDVECKKITVIE
jgi:hypothetical protein